MDMMNSGGFSLIKLLILMGVTATFGSVDQRRANLVPLDTFFGNNYKLEKTLSREQFTERNRAGVDYRERDTPIKQQWNGTCTAFGGVAGIENLLGGKVELSERDAWSRYHEYSVYSFVDALKGAYICDEKNWKQDAESMPIGCATNRYWGLTDVDYLGSDIDAALDALDAGSVVYLGLNTPEDMLACSSYINPETDFSDGGHAVLIVGYDPQQEHFIIKNSWGEECGDYGYQYLPFSVCQRKEGYCFMWDFQKAESIKPQYKYVTTCKRLWWTLWLKKKCTTKKVKI